VEEHAPPRTLPDLAQAAPVPGSRAEVELARVLDGQHVAALDRDGGSFAPARDQTLDRDLEIAQKAPEADFRRTAPGRLPPKADVTA
jgi:hypothetical protein